MRAVLPIRPDQPPIPEIGELPDPVAGHGEALIRVHATALNRADLLQLRGLYPPPPGESEVPGLECAGTIESLGDGDPGPWRVGQRVMALLAGGGQGEKVAVPLGQLMPIPEGMSFEDAAALPEAALTAWTNLVAEGGLAPDPAMDGSTEPPSVLITAAASGIGTFAVQLARELGARVLVAGRTMARLERLRPLGADHCILLDDGLPDAVRRATDGRGVDLILELAGGPTLATRLSALRRRGRLVLVGILAGTRAEIDLGDMLRRRLQLVGSVLRARPRDEKARLIHAFQTFARGRLADGRLRPVVDRVVPFEHIAEAYAAMERGGIFGKIVVRVG